MVRLNLGVVAVVAGGFVAVVAGLSNVVAGGFVAVVAGLSNGAAQPGGCGSGRRLREARDLQGESFGPANESMYAYSPFVMIYGEPIGRFVHGYTYAFAIF
ncbi:hypothetical protein EJB05_16745, partial [Eragrostis curvula]